MHDSKIILGGKWIHKFKLINTQVGNLYILGYFLLINYYVDYFQLNNLLFAYLLCNSFVRAKKDETVFSYWV